MQSQRATESRKTPLVANPDFDLVGESRRSFLLALPSLLEQHTRRKRNLLYGTGSARSSETDQLVWGPLPGAKRR